MKKSLLLTLLATCFILASVPPCFAADEYIFIVRTRGNPYWNLLADGIRDAAKELKVNAVVYQSETETASEEQLNTCYTAIERAPKLIAVAATNIDTGIQCLRKAAEKGIQVAELDSSIPIDRAEKAGVHLAFSIGSDNFSVGERAAELAAKILPATGAKILVLEGAAATPQSIKRVGGFVKRLAELSPQAKIVASLPADWDRMKALSVVTNILQREPELTMIYTANDMMALGAAEALKIAGKTGKISIIGVDGVADARKAVLEGKLTATVAQLPYYIGHRAVELAVKADAKTVREDTPTPVLTREMLEKNTDPILKYVR